MLVWPDEVSRPFCISGAHDLCPDCLGSLRPSERNGTEMQVRAALATAEIEVKWSGAGAKLASQSRARAEPCRHLAVRSRTGLQRKCRLGEATWKMLTRLRLTSTRQEPEILKR